MSPIRAIDPAPVPPDGGRPGGLGQRLRDSLVSFFVDAYNRIRDTVADTLRAGVDKALEELEGPLISFVGPVIDDMLDNPELPQSYRQMLLRAKSGEAQVGVVILTGVAVAAAMFLGPAALSGLAAKVQQASYNLFNPNLLDFSTWWAAEKRARVYGDAMLGELAKQGWTEQQVEAAKVAAERRLGVNEIILAVHRGELTEGQAQIRLQEHLIRPEDAVMLLKVSVPLPSATDGVRYATREAWRDDVAQRWQFDAGRPGELDALLDKLGFDPWVAEKEWRAHWVLPSVGMGLEMYFRGEIGADDLRQLIVMLDIAPGWIDPILNTARPLPGRIDRRWAFEEGVIGEEELYQLYRNDGMDEFWARTMVQMVVSKTSAEAKGLTRSAVQAAYQKRRLSRAEAVGLLADIGIQDHLANWYLDQADLDLREEQLDRQKDLVGQQYANGLLSDARAREELQGIGLPSDEVEFTLEEWSLKRRTTVKIPSRTNLEEFYRQGVLGVDQFREQMGILGYGDQYIGWYLSSLSFELAVTATQEEERAQKERIRVETERRESAYAKAKARIDQDIAELNAAIADGQVALVEAQNEKARALEQALSTVQIAELQQEYSPLFHEVDAAIAQARLSIQAIQVGIQERAARVNDLRRSLAAGRDLVAQEALERERLQLQTSLAQLAKQIAQRRTDIAILEESAPLAAGPEEAAALEQEALTLQREIREIEEQQAGLRVQVEQIDEQLPVELSAARRVEIQTAVDTWQGESDQLRLEREALEEDVREAQKDRLELQRELDGEVLALPGRAEQIEIEAVSDALIDKLRARIQVLRANVAQLRVDKAELTVGWRESSV